MAFSFSSPMYCTQSQYDFFYSDHTKVAYSATMGALFSVVTLFFTEPKGSSGSYIFGTLASLVPMLSVMHSKDCSVTDDEYLLKQQELDHPNYYDHSFKYQNPAIEQRGSFRKKSRTVALLNFAVSSAVALFAKNSVTRIVGTMGALTPAIFSLIYFKSFYTNDQYSFPEEFSFDISLLKDDGSSPGLALNTKYTF